MRQGFSFPPPAGPRASRRRRCSLAVFPANVQMSIDQGRRADRKGDPASRASFAATLARLPLQVPLIRTALRAAGR